MKTLFSRSNRLLLSLSLIAASLALNVAANGDDEARRTVNAPGFRPESPLSQTFVERVDSSRIAVLPTLIRTRDGAAHSDLSRDRIVAFLKENRLGVAEARPTRVDVGKLKGKFQYDVFKNDLKTIGKTVKKLDGADYFVVLEHLVTPTPSGDIAIGGIHLFLLDAKGENAFSFLLNSHHKLFVEAALRSADSSPDGRNRLAMKGTEIALEAMKEQIAAARETE